MISIVEEGIKNLIRMVMFSLKEFDTNFWNMRVFFTAFDVLQMITLPSRAVKLFNLVSLGDCRRMLGMIFLIELLLNIFTALPFRIKFKVSKYSIRLQLSFHIPQSKINYIEIKKNKPTRRLMLPMKIPCFSSKFFFLLKYFTHFVLHIIICIIVI